MHENQKGLYERPKKRALLSAALICVALLIYMTLNANIVRVACTDIPVSGLSEELDGFTIIYISDFKLTSRSSLTRVEALFDDLEHIHPDILILGGDYTGYDFFGQILNRRSNADYNQGMIRLRQSFFKLAGSFNAPFGVYAVVGDRDNSLSRYDQDSLSASAGEYGVHLLINESVSLNVPGRQRLILAGADDWHTGTQVTENLFYGLRDDDCVIVLTHTPDFVPVLLSQQGGHFADIILSGHTLGGKIKLAGRELFNPLTDTRRFSAGWHDENGIRFLISEGLNTDWPSLRFGTEPQVHVLRLVRA